MKIGGFKSYSALDEINDKYDFILTSNVLKHIEDAVKALSDIRSKLVSAGNLVIFVPALEVIWSPMDVAVGHHRRYKNESLLKILETNDYNLKHIRYCDSLGFVPPFIFKYVGSKNGGPSSTSLSFFDKYLLPVSKATDVLVCGQFGKNVLTVATLNEALHYSNVQ